MNGLWTVVAGLALLLMLASVAALVGLLLPRYRPMHTQDSDTWTGPDSLAARVAARAALEHGRRRKVLVAAVSGVLAATLLVLLVMLAAGAPRPSWTPQVSAPLPAQPGTAGTGAAPSPPAGPSTFPAYPAALFVGIFAMGAGTLLLLAGQTRPVKFMGGVALAAGLLGEAHLIREVNFGDLFKFDTRIDKPALNVNLELAWRDKLAQLSSFGPKRLATIDHFDTGKAEIRPDMRRGIDTVCARWKDQGGELQRGLILIIGSADRVPLRAAIRRQYDSNMGLARARAEQVKAEVLKCKIPEEQIVTLVAGPRHTPEADPPSAPAGFGEDRSVVVWALWSVPAVPGKPGAALPAP